MSALSKSVEIAATPQQVLDVLLDVETYADWQKEVQQVEVVAKDDLGRPARTTVHVKAMGQSSSYTVEYDYPSDGVVEYHLVEGELMTKNDARFTTVDKGDGTTELTVEMDLALVWALPAVVTKQMIVKGIKDMCKGVKARAEGE